MSAPPVCPVDGLPYTGHGPSRPPTRGYLHARSRFTGRLLQTMPWPDTTTREQRAIVRARRDRLAVAA